MAAETFAEAGYALVPEILNAAECAAVCERVAPLSLSRSTRCLLDEEWCVSLAKRILVHPGLSSALPRDYLPVQCTYFEKSSEANWLVPMHQDLSIPVAERIANSDLRGWSEKEGTLFVQAPVAVLETLVAVRVHLETCNATDGPLRVIPGSHRHGRIDATTIETLRRENEEVCCVAAEGEALVLRPLLLHASSKATGSSRRRVLHFLYGPPSLPHGLRWRRAA